MKDKTQILQNDALRTANKTTRKMHVTLEELHKNGNHHTDRVEERLGRSTKRYLLRKRNDQLMKTVMHRIHNPRLNRIGWHRLMKEHFAT